LIGETSSSSLSEDHRRRSGTPSPASIAAGGKRQHRSCAMIYGLDRALPSDKEAAAAGNNPACMAAWRKLDEQSRLRLVERELNAPRHLIDGYPLAL